MTERKTSTASRRAHAVPSALARSTMTGAHSSSVWSSAMGCFPSRRLEGSASAPPVALGDLAPAKAEAAVVTPLGSILLSESVVVVR
jgi:hypothetical protein